MADDAVLDVVDAGDVSTDVESPEIVADEPQKEVDKQDNRRLPDALKKHIGDLRRQADGITDPAEKKAALDRIKLLYDTTGKAHGYEEQFPTVAEARQVKALLDSVGGSDGFRQMQATLSEVEQIDQMLSVGDASVVDRMWQEAPEGMPKLVPAIIDRFAREKPQEYLQFIAPKSIGYLDQSGFPQAFDRMIQAYEAGKLDDAKAIRDRLIEFVVANRQQGAKEQGTDPEVKRLREELAKRDQTAESQKVDAAYSSVVEHAGSAIDAAARPFVAKLGMTREEMSTFRQAVWDQIEKTRNQDPTYKTVAPAKAKQGYDKWSEYAKNWTKDNAETAIRAVLRTPPWNRLTATQKPAVTSSPGKPAVQQGKEPSPSEIDYSAKGLAAAKKAGFKDVGDMILSGQAPMRSGGIRKWR